MVSCSLSQVASKGNRTKKRVSGLSTTMNQDGWMALPRDRVFRSLPLAEDGGGGSKLLCSGHVWVGSWEQLVDNCMIQEFGLDGSSLA